MEKAEEVCEVCGNTRDNHPYRHLFVPDGKDPELKLPKAQPAAKPVPNPATDAIVFRLIQLLVRKGLVNGDELAVILGASPGPSSGEDRGDRSSEEPMRGGGVPDRGEPDSGAGEQG